MSLFHHQHATRQIHTKFYAKQAVIMPCLAAVQINLGVHPAGGKSWLKIVPAIHSTDTVLDLFHPNFIGICYDAIVYDIF